MGAKGRCCITSRKTRFILFHPFNCNGFVSLFLVYGFCVCSLRAKTLMLDHVKFDMK